MSEKPKKKEHKKFRKNSSANKRNSETVKQSSIVILTTNAAGLRYKDSDLKNKVKCVNSSIFTVQETHYTKKGKFEMENYNIFETIRKCKQKGGSMLGIHMDLHPVLVNEYSEEFELMVAEITTGNTKIRIMTGYGPQESWKDQERLPFF